MTTSRASGEPAPAVRGTRLGSEIGKRVAVAVVLLPLVALLLWRGGLWCGALLALAAAVATREYLRLALPAAGLGGWLAVGVAAALPLLPVVAPGQVGVAACSLVAALSVGLWTLHLAAGPRQEAPVRIGHMLTAVIFVGGGLLALSVLRAGPRGLGWASAVLVGSWANDTAAFFSGKALGRHKLLPAVSPGKTWEGLLGGLLGGVAALVLAAGFLLPALGVLECLLLGALMGVFGPLGDLSKSMLKRAYHVKDAGRILPGHGGMLDRIDAVLFNAPVVLILRWLVDA